MAHTIVTAESSVKPKEAADRRKSGDFQRVESGIRKIEVRRLGTADMSVFIISMQEPVLHRVRVARQDAADMDTDWIDHLMLAVDQAVPRLLEIQDTAAGGRPAPGKWSPKEIIGHLIDSAVNNQARFVRAQMQDDLVFDGYDQDAWVRVQRYQDRSWPDLVRTWRTYNEQVAAIMRAAPAHELDRVRARNNLHEIGFEPLPPGEPPTLAFLMRDYVAHLQHHLRQVFSSYGLSLRP